MRRDHADHRRDDQPIAGGELIQSSQYPDTLRTNADLFVAFAQRSVDYVAIARIDSSSRKGDLPSRSTQMIGSFGQHALVNVLRLLDTSQHSRWRSRRRRRKTNRSIPTAFIKPRQKIFWKSAGP